MPAVVLRPSAKINLTLDVGPGRADGYHDVRTVLQSIALSDVLAVVPAKGPFELTVKNAVVPVDSTNLVTRAARALWTAMGREGDPSGARVTPEKHIPVGAGLGGGSADAAAALVGLNRVWKARLSRADLIRVAATLGADVPFFLVGGTAVGVGRGDEIYPLADIPRLGLVIVQPDFSVATADAYRWFDEVTPDSPAAGAEPVDLGWPSGPLHVRNSLQAPVADRHPAIAHIVRACLAAGAVTAAMTGSGSAVFGVFPVTQTAAIARKLARKATGWSVWPTTTLSRRDACRRIRL